MIDNQADILKGFALILSNIGIVPAIALTAYYKLIPEATIYSVVCFISTIYHICQSDFFCIYPFKALQTSDHFFVFGLLVWTTLYFIDLELPSRFAVFIIVQSFLLPAVIQYLESWWIGGVLLAFLIILSLFILSFVTQKIQKPDFVDLILALILIGGGFFFHIYAGEPGAPNYWWAHSIWHLLGMFSLFFVIQMKSGKGTLHKLLFHYRMLFGSNKKEKYEDVEIQNPTNIFEKIIKIV